MDLRLYETYKDYLAEIAVESAWFKQAADKYTRDALKGEVARLPERRKLYEELQKYRIDMPDFTTPFSFPVSPQGQW